MHEFNRETEKGEEKGTIKSKSGVRAGIDEADDLQLHRNNLTVFEKNGKYVYKGYDAKGVHPGGTNCIPFGKPLPDGRIHRKYVAEIEKMGCKMVSFSLS